MIRFQTLLSLVLLVRIPATLSDVTWDSPSQGDVYTPGDTLQAVWNSPDKIISPSFTICTANTSTSGPSSMDCGTAVWPSVAQNGSEYSISLAVPNLTGNGDYYLVMTDDRGTTYDTPKFSLALTEANATVNATSSSNTAGPTDANVNYLPSHSGPSIALVAIPLSLVAATLLVALLLLLCRLRRSRQRERDKEKNTRTSEKFRWGESTISFASATDIERAVLALAAARDYGAPGPPQAPQPPPGMTVVDSYGQQNLAAATAAALGMGAFGWAYRFGQPPQLPPRIPNLYAPAPPYGASVETCPINQPQTQYVASNPPLSQSHPRGDPSGQEIVSRPGHWRDVGQTLARRPSVPLQPPQLPAIEVHASSPPSLSLPPPVPPKQLIPGSPLSQTPRPYEPPYSSPLPQPVGRSSSASAMNAHASLNVISSYMQVSPAIPQGDALLAPLQPDFQLPRLPTPSPTRTRSLRRLETSAGAEAQLAQPEDRAGTYLYDAVSKAVGR